MFYNLSKISRDSLWIARTNFVNTLVRKISNSEENPWFLMGSTRFDPDNLIDSRDFDVCIKTTLKVADNLYTSGEVELISNYFDVEQISGYALKPSEVFNQYNITTFVFRYSSPCLGQIDLAIEIDSVTYSLRRDQHKKLHHVLKTSTKARKLYEFLQGQNIKGSIIYRYLVLHLLDEYAI